MLFRSIEGFKYDSVNAIKVKIKLLDFEILPEKLSETNTMVNRNGQSIPVYSGKYEISYKHPLGVTVISPSGQTILEEFPPQMNSFSTYFTSVFNSKSELLNYWGANSDAEKEDLQRKAMYQNLDIINKDMNSKFGFVKVSKEIELYSVKDKKNNYSDYEQAYTLAFEGFLGLESESTRPDAIAKLKQAAVIWEKALLESNPEDKKARIDKNVTQATLFNLIEAYILSNEFSKAESSMGKLSISDISRREKDRLERLIAFEKVQKERYLANNK